MKKVYFEAIRSGRKTTTLRYWKSRRVRPGAVHTVPGLGKVRIDSVRTLAEAEITEKMARADGFDSAEALRAALSEHYTEPQRRQRRLFLVEFSLVRDSAEGR